MTADAPTELDIESIVKERYATGAQQQEKALCCPVDYDPRFLEIIPTEVIAKDYGCGDPSRYLKPGETVLDLGSGTGKICFIAAQVVGAEGKVIGIDMTEDMLEVARRNAPIVAQRVGYSNVDFRRGRIQDLALDLDALDQLLQESPVTTVEHMLRLQQLTQELRKKKPLVASDSVDVVVSNCVLNLVASDEKPALFDELHRVLRNGGRAVISDIVSDEPVPQSMQEDPELWSGCISGALTETGFLEAFEEAGFFGISLLEREAQPWRTVEGIEFRSVVIEAFKGKEGPCLERNQAVIYKGPFREILDDDQHRMVRGRRYAVCDKTFNLYKSPAYEGLFEFVDPLTPIAVEEAKPFDCSRTTERHPKETKGHDYTLTSEAAVCCGADVGS